MKNDVILAIDAGTGSCRVIAFDYSGNVMDMQIHEWKHRTDPEGYYTFNADAYMDVLSAMMSKALSNYRVTAISVSSQRNGMVFLDQNGRELYAGLNLDLRGEEVMKVLKPFAAEIRESTGLPLHAMFGLPRLLWFREKDPETYEKIYTVLMICDWIAFRLTGVFRSEKAAASSSQMLNLFTGSFDINLMNRLGLRNDIFPEPCTATEKIGFFTDPLSGEKIPVFIGGSDTHCGAVGNGCCRSGDWVAVAGTTTPILVFSDEPLVDRENGLYSSFGSRENTWVLEGNADSTGLSYRWLKQLMYASESEEHVYRLMECEAAKISPGSKGMDSFVGIGIRGIEKGPNHGGFSFPVPWNIDEISRGCFARSVLESNAYALAANLKVMVDVTGKTPEVLSVCGGQSKSSLWLSILADTLQMPVSVHRQRESTAVGAAILASVGLGIYADTTEAAAKMNPLESILESEEGSPYPELFQIWLRHYEYSLNFK